MVANEYDVLGRMVRRSDYRADLTLENHTRWYYDSIGPDGLAVANAVGQVTGVVMSQNLLDETCDAATTQYCRLHSYDSLGRAVGSEVRLGTAANEGIYATQTSYDAIGRADISRDVLDGKVYEDVGGTPVAINSGVQNLYNAYGYLYQVNDLKSGETLRLIQAQNARGQVTDEQLGNGVTSQYGYEATTGRMLSQHADLVFGLTNVQHIEYQWDVLGNLLNRHNTSGDGANQNDLQESFCYDGLNRLIKTIAGASGSLCTGLSLGEQDMRYDSLGNITYKQNVGTYAYGSNAGPHAVTSTSDGVVFSYDANGNMTADTAVGDIGGRTLLYTTFDKPYQITRGDHVVDFFYGPERKRYQRVDQSTSTTTSGGGGGNGGGNKKKGGGSGGGTSTSTTTTLYLGAVERIEESGSNEVKWKRYIGGFAVFTLTTQSQSDGGQLIDVITAEEQSYLYKDHLGSLDVITDAAGTPIQGMSFNAWGQRRSSVNWTELDPISSYGFDNSITTRGYTEHEMLDEVGLIHMNGRIYDPRLGRFMQADPFIQAATDTQMLNRYSYVRNNPLNATDPSGYFKLMDLVKVVAVVAISVVTYGAASAWAMSVGVQAFGGAMAITGAQFATVSVVAGAVGGAAAGFVAGVSMSAFSGASLSDAFSAGFNGAISGAVFGGIAGAYGRTWNSSRIGANSLAGGLTTKATGGEFKDGFRSALAVSMLTYGNYMMRQSRVDQLQKSGNPRNLNGESQGFFGDNLKLAGAGEVITPDGRRIACVSLMGGCQGAPVNPAIDTRSSFFGWAYDPGSLPDTINESFAGPHDWLRNATGSYITDPSGPYEVLGNGKYLSGIDAMIDNIKNYALVLPAAPFAMSGLIDYSGAYGVINKE